MKEQLLILLSKSILSHNQFKNCLIVTVPTLANMHYLLVWSKNHIKVEEIKIIIK